MAVLRTRQLFIASQEVAGAAEDVLVVPAGKRYIIRDLRVSNRTGVAPGTVLVLLNSSGGHQLALYQSTTLGAYQSDGSSVDVALESGDKLTVFSEQVGTVYCATGADLDLSE